jgi:integration host factor subunit beta
MTRSELVARLYRRLRPVPIRDVECGLRAIQDGLIAALREGRRIEIRGFGNFRVRYRRARVGRNPKTGARVLVPEKGYTRFSPGSELRERVQEAEGTSAVA